MSEQNGSQERDARGLVWLLVCFTCSGMSALIYEVAWVRSLELIFGATTFAVATVLAAFMGGLAFGSFLMGRMAQRLARYHPLKVYALMECGIGVMALLIPLVFTVLAPLYQAVWRHYHASYVVFSALRFVLCVAILLVPTSLMGATLPIMSAFVNRNAAAGAGQRRIGLLYTVNTAGAVLGCLTAGFLLFPLVGLQKTQYIAVTLSSMAALGAFVLARQIPWAGSQGIPATTMSDASVADSPVRARTWLIVTIYAVSGFSAMLYEVAWSRVLVQVLGSSTYAYTIMLATFLFGLAAGAWLGTRYLLRVAEPLWAAGLCQAVVALTTYMGLFAVEELPFLYTKLYGLLQPKVPGTMAMLFLLSFGLMLLPTLALGAMFPVAIHGLNPTGGKTARIVGWAYSFNTLGAIAGSVTAGFFLMPQVGMQYTLLVGVALNGLMAAVAFAAARSGRLVRYRFWLAGLLGVFVVNSLVQTPAWEPHFMASGIFRYVRNYLDVNRAQFRERLLRVHGDIAYYKEGLTCNVIIFRTATSMSLLVNGKPDASTPPGIPHPEFALLPQSEGDLPTQIMLGEAPLLLAPQHERVMVIGLGSGVTLGSVLRHEVKAVECVELEEAVVKGSQWFNPYNGRPLADPRVKLVVNDARNHLLVTDQQYDVIISEPSNPWIPGAAALFTREFFALSKQRLRPGGVFCQWVQLYELHPADLQIILRSLRSVYPHLHIFRVNADAVILATTAPLPLNYEQLRARLTPAIRADLATIHIQEVEDLLAHYWIGPGELNAALPPGPINTDDNMHIEFRAPLRMLVPETQRELGLRQLFKDSSTALVPQLATPGMPVADQSAFWSRFATAALGQRRPNEAMLYAKHSLELKGNGPAAATYGEAMDFARLPQAAEWWTAARTNYPNSPEVLRGLVRHLHQQTNWLAARVVAEKFCQLQPDDAEGRYLLGKSLVKLKEWPAASAAFGPLLQGYAAHTNWADLPLLAGATLFHAGQYADALPPLSKALTLDYWDLEPRHLRAEALARLGREKEAVLEWQRLGQLRSSQAQNRLTEARQATRRGDADLAERKLVEAYELDPWEPTIVVLLARMHVQNGQIKEAIALIESHLQWDHDRDWAVGFLGELYGKAGDEAKARSLLLRYRTLTGKDWTGFEE